MHMKILFWKNPLILKVAKKAIYLFSVLAAFVAVTFATRGFYGQEFVKILNNKMKIVK